METPTTCEACGEVFDADNPDEGEIFWRDSAPLIALCKRCIIRASNTEIEGQNG